MAYIILNNSVNGIHGVKEFGIDSENDLKDLPKACGVGSTAILIKEDAVVYMKNFKGEWVKI